MASGVLGMAYEYLKALSLTDEEEEKLRTLGVGSASSLLSLIEHAPEKFSQFFGEERTRRIRTLLPSLIPEEEKAQFAALPAFRGKFGARIVPSEPNASRDAATRRRDELMHRIRMIRESGASSSKAKALLEDLENEFRSGLKSTVSGGA